VLQEVEVGLLGLAGMTPTGATISVECLGHSPGWPGGEETKRLFACWEAAAADLGMQVVSVSRGGLSDANYLWDLGPTLDALGPVGGHAHCSETTADGSKTPEFVEPATFVPKAVLNIEALRRLLQGEL
jgi:glutamate carboxypeptidase